MEITKKKQQQQQLTTKIISKKKEAKIFSLCTNMTSTVCWNYKLCYCMSHLV